MARFETPGSDDVDTDKPYDIYVEEGHKRVVVYRRAKFLGIKKLLTSGRIGEFRADFIEIELENGNTLFVRKFNVLKFCEPGSDVGGEMLPPPT